MAIGDIPILSMLRTRLDWAQARQKVLAEMERLGDAARIYAGGAELLLLMRHGLLEPDYLVNIKQVPSLHGISWDGQLLHLGAAVTHRQLERDPQVHAHAPTLGEAEHHIGNIRVRTQGTLGGNLAFADPHADPGTALLVHDATVTLEGARGPRQLSLDDFFVSTHVAAFAPPSMAHACRNTSATGAKTFVSPYGTHGPSSTFAPCCERA